MQKQIEEVMALVEAYGITASFGSSADLPAGRVLIEAKLRELLPVWQPIESAYRNGDSFIGYSPVFGQMVCAFNCDEERFFEIGGGSVDLTHWQPMQKDPQ